jgi:hypothetical protein
MSCESPLIRVYNPNDHNPEVLAQYLAVSRAASCIFFEQLLNLECLTELVDGRRRDAAKVCV